MTTRRILLVGGAVLLAGWLLSGVAVIRPGERAVVRRFGAIVAHPGPGLWIGLPYGIDRLDRLPVQTVRECRIGFDPRRDNPEDGRGQYLTGDHNLVEVELVVNYSIDETPAALDDHILHRDRAVGILARLAEAAAAEWIAAQPVDRVLLTSGVELSRWVEQRLAERLPRFRLGLIVQRVSVAHLAPPAAVRPSFEAVAQAQAGIGTRRMQAQQQAQQRLRQAESFAFRLEQEAVAAQEAYLRQAQADSVDFHARRHAFRSIPPAAGDPFAIYWWQEMTRALQDLISRGGRVEPLDAHLGPNGLDLTHLLRSRPPR